VFCTAPGASDYGFNLTPYLTNVTPDWPVDEIDVTTLGNTERQYIPGFKSATMGVEGVFDPVVNNVLFGMRGGSAGPLRYYPQGTATGKPYFQGTVLLLNYSPPTDVESAVTFTGSFRFTNGVLLGTA